MIRPILSEDLVNEVIVLSENGTGNFEDSLRTLVEKYKKLIRRSKAV